MTPCEQAGVHLRGTGHSQTECPTLDDVADMAKTATVRRVARPHGVLSEKTLKELKRLGNRRDDAESAYRARVVHALDEGSFSAVAEATGLSTNTLQRWKRETGDESNA